jgi:hypothetical protein
MMITLKKIAITAATLCALTAAPFASAELLTFDIKWANKAGVTTAVAELTMDSDLVGIGVINPQPIDIQKIGKLTLTVSGANVGNGVFTKNDFKSVFFYATGPLDWTHELIGQRINLTNSPFGQATYGDVDGVSGAFDLFAWEKTTPTGVRPFSMATDRTFPVSDELTVSSIIAREAGSAVPEPETYAMLLAGLGLLGWRARRRA